MPLNLTESTEWLTCKMVINVSNGAMVTVATVLTFPLINLFVRSQFKFKCTNLISYFNSCEICGAKADVLA